MSDHDQYWIWVYDCPVQEQPAVADVLSDLVLREDQDLPDDGTITTSEPYVEPESGFTDRGSIADRLIEAAPGTSFYSWHGPWPGDKGPDHPDDLSGSGAVSAYTPDLGRHDGDCDANGRPVLYPAQIRHLLRDHPGASAAALVEKLARWAGEPWEADLLARTGRLRPGPSGDETRQQDSGG